MTDQDDDDIPISYVERIIKGLTLKYDPNDNSFVVKFPAKIPKGGKEAADASKNVNVRIESSDGKIVRLTPADVPTSERETIFNDEDLDPANVLSTESIDSHVYKEPKTSDAVHVKVMLKAYIKMALHSLKYAHPNANRKTWVEVIGLMTGYIENSNSSKACMIISDAWPIGHGNDVNVQIQDPQSHVRVYKELKGEMVLGWYHSHPSYSPFMSDTDYDTQVRYQKLGGTKGKQQTAPVALVIDPTEITTESYGFKIFRLTDNYQAWEEPKFEVVNCPLESLPEMLRTLLPLSEGRAMFLEYDHEK